MNHKVVSPAEWTAARKELLAAEKEFTRLRDELSRKRRELPWEKVEKQYWFDGPGGTRSLSDLFQGKSQLAVYHFMFSPEWEEGCKHCSFWADNFNGIDVHLKHRDVSFVAISRAPLAKLESFKKRMDWTFQWFSSNQTDFNYDFNVSFTPEQQKSGSIPYNYTQMNCPMADREGMSLFFKNEKGEIFHTYSTYARGIDIINCAYNILDFAPKGRDENPEFSQSWVRHHDRYED